MRILLAVNAPEVMHRLQIWPCELKNNDETHAIIKMDGRMRWVPWTSVRYVEFLDDA